MKAIFHSMQPLGKTAFRLLWFTFLIGLGCQVITGPLDDLRKKAEGGDAQAQLVLAERYDAGIGVSKDSTEAAKWYLKAAEQGLVEAQYNRGVMYDKGEGVQKDLAMAFHWFSAAAEQGDPAAQNWVGWA